MDQAKNTFVCDSMLQELHQPCMVNVVEEAFDVSVQYPIHALLQQCIAQQIEVGVSTG